MMKKIKHGIALLLAVTLILTLSACGSKLKGTYVSEGLISQTFTFDGDDVTMSAFGINVSGKYKISGNQIIITYSLLGLENTWTQSFSKSGKTINIGGTDFVKR